MASLHGDALVKWRKLTNKNPWEVLYPNARKGARRYIATISIAFTQAGNALVWSHSKQDYLTTTAKVERVAKLMRYAHRARTGK